MFEVNTTTKQITMHRGDTGSIAITFNGYDLNNVNAWCLFSLRQGQTIVKEECHKIEDNKIYINFKNEDTDWVNAGNTFEYDVRVVIDPVFDENGIPTDGTVVRTPSDPIPVNIRRTIGMV